MRKRPLVASLALLGIVVALGLLATLARAQGARAETVPSASVPAVVSYQGEVWTGSPLSPYNGTGYCKFAIVDAGGTTSYWSNDGSSVGGDEPNDPVELDVQDGIFAVLLGDESLAHMVALSPAVFSGHDTYLQVWFADDTAGSYTDLGRTRIAAVPYALVVPWSGIDGVPVDLADGDDDTTYSAGTGINIASSVISAQGSPYAGELVVAKNGGDFDTIGDALASITPSSSNRYLVRVAPGTYEEQVTMKPYVSIQGAGRDLTTVTSDASSASLEHPGATVELASHAALRDLTVIAEGTSAYTSRAAVLAYDITSAEVANVTARGSGAIYVYGIYDYSSPLLVQDCIVSAKAYTRGKGIRLRSASSVVIADTSAFGGGIDGGYGIYATESSVTVERVFAEGDSADLSSGIYTDYGQLTVRDSTAIASESPSVNFQSAGLYEKKNDPADYTEVIDTVAAGRMGMYSYCSAPHVTNCGTTTLRHSQLDGVEYGLNTYTVNSLTHEMTVDGCQLEGSTRSISLSGTVVYVGASMLDGVAGGTTSNYHCSATYDAAYAALDSQCQP